MPTRSPWTVTDRLNSLISPPVKPDGTLAMADWLINAAAKLADGEKVKCTVDRYCRIRIFELPRILSTEPVPHYTIYQSDSVHAALVCDLHVYFETSPSPHYALSPSLRHEVGELSENTDSGNDSVVPYLVIEEENKLAPVALDRVSVSLDEVYYKDEQPHPLLTGGRTGARFITVWETSDGPWPEIPQDESTINTILAMVRAHEDIDTTIPKRLDQRCFITDNHQFVCPMSAGFMSATLSVSKPVSPDEFRKTAQVLSVGIPRMIDDLHRSDHLKLLVNALYWDDGKDDDFRRLHYLNLWQSLCESRRRLGYVPPSRGTGLSSDPTIVAGAHSLAELNDYRVGIAHHRTSGMDGNYLADLYQTINELIRQSYCP